MAERTILAVVEAESYDDPLPVMTGPAARLYGDVSGIQPGDSVNVTIAQWATDSIFGNGKIVGEYEIHNGRNVFTDIELEEGRYALFVNHPKYDSQQAGMAFTIHDSETIFQYRWVQIELYTEEQWLSENDINRCGFKGHLAYALAKRDGDKYHGCDGGGISHKAEAQLSGQLLGLDPDVSSVVKIYRLPNLEGISYVSTGREDVKPVFPDLLVEVEKLEDFSTDELIAEMQFDSSDWSVRGFPKAGRYLVVADADGMDASPIAYIASTIGGRGPSNPVGVDFGFEAVDNSTAQNELTPEQVLIRASETLDGITSYKTTMTFDEPMQGSTQLTSIENIVKLPGEMISFATGAGEPRFQRGYSRGGDCFTDEGLNGEWRKRSIPCGDPELGHSKMISMFAMSDPQFMAEPPTASSGLYWITGSASGSWSNESLDDSIRVDRLEVAFDKGSGRIIRALVYKDADKSLYLTYDMTDYNSAFYREFLDIERELRELDLWD